MPLSNTLAGLLSEKALREGLVETEPKRIGLMDLLPFFPVFGDALEVPRVTAANFGSAAWDTGGAAVSDTSAVPTDPNASFPLKLLVTAFKMNFVPEKDYSNVNDQVEVQQRAAVQRLYYKFFETLNVGDNSANPQEFDGLRRLVTSGQTLTARGGAGGIPALRELDQLVGLIKTNGGRPDALYTSRKGYEAIKRAHYRAQVPLGSVERRGAVLPAFDGVPIVVDDQVPDNETANNYTSVYALVLGRNGLYGIVPEGYEKRMVRMDRTFVSGLGQESWVVWWPVGLALEAVTGAARLQQVG